ncbi:MAG TPA: 5-formyltetrahydrofolate cyclo-ligase, partial [Thermoplasmatales archaeon]|nr:5-formyltetrahydrofolate cyclo-ligase [Thermoplasmatales archaeon]
MPVATIRVFPFVVISLTYIMVVETKREIRDRILRLRRNLDREKIKNLSRTIRERLFDLDEYKEAEVVMAYYSFDNEVETMEMIKESLKKKTVLLPAIEGNKILPIEIMSLDELEPGCFGIPEPTCRKRVFDKEKIDVILVPGIAFDIKG